MLYTFKPNVKYLGKVEINDDFRYEPMFFGADISFVKEYSKGVTSEIVSVLEDFNVNMLLPKGYNFLIDTRVNMLMKGFYPSIPGWHCDDFSRGENGQPDMEYDENIKHYMVLLSDNDSHLSGTEFVTETFTCDLDSDNIWKSLNCHVEQNKYETRKLETGKIIEFDQNCVHRATEALSNGWRLFFRASITKRDVKNEIRNQTQTYVDLNTIGW